MGVPIPRQWHVVRAYGVGRLALAGAAAASTQVKSGQTGDYVVHEEEKNGRDLSKKEDPRASEEWCSQPNPHAARLDPPERAPQHILRRSRAPVVDFSPG